MSTRKTINEPPREPLGLLSLPAELRLHILEFVFEDEISNACFMTNSISGDLYACGDYAASPLLQPLLVCKQMHRDASLLAFSRTNFIVSNLFFDIRQRLSTLHPKQISSIRSIAFLADDRAFRKLHTWTTYPFNLSSLNLNTLTIVLHRSSFWHYLFDYTADIVKLLRNLQGVQKFVFVRNGALVKGSLKTWYNRLVGLMLKIDHHERYMLATPNPENTWWKWSFDEVAQRICLEAQPAKVMTDEEAYMESIKPFMEELRASVESEEWNPDPRARNHYY